MRSLTVVGASVAGWHLVHALLAHGYEGPVTVVDRQTHHPYDRPPLSKEFLLGRRGVEGMRFGDYPSESNVVWRLGVEATALSDGAVELSDGSILAHDDLVIATGLRRPDLNLLTSPPQGVHELRTLDDALKLRLGLVRARNVVVVGGGFIGCEVASACRHLSVPVTIVEADERLGERSLGVHAHLVEALHETHGTSVITGARVTEFVGDPVTAVRLADGRNLSADLVVVGIGSMPATKWLEGSSLELGNGVRCDTLARTNLPGVYAIGDVAEVESEWASGPRRFEHWTSAVDQAMTLADHLVGRPPRSPSPPYWWFDIYGHRIQVAGRLDLEDDVRVVDVGGGYLATHHVDGAPVGVAAVDSPREFARVRRTLTPPFPGPSGSWSAR
ncbi:FAD-dependent oxidoreductase [Dactylosporangium roseum]|uniref:FAD-dependent oxidoreductase n=1 Tax=Dactylosporangium roseum TaxID=47989 RepID=A0ABY5ZFI5_9ACTN|nr:FAD-dependent oxidoreductase [Dactylosporangium roseum]UWZ39718.1 FAD-dependent oxidoreductase [Dactylosporangium roseum]